MRACDGVSGEGAAVIRPGFDFVRVHALRWSGFRASTRKGRTIDDAALLGGCGVIAYEFSFSASSR